MTVPEARKIFVRKFPQLKIVSGVEYASIYVFNAIRKDQKLGTGMHTQFDTLYSVDKKSGEIMSFNPLHMPIEEYKQGKKLF